MSKRIYDGHDNGLFNFGPFERFMESLKDAEPILRSKGTADGPLHQIWHYNLVTIDYWNNGYEYGPAKVKIDLYGSKKKISEVEKIILEAAKTNPK